MKIIALNKGEKNGIIKKEKGMHQNEYYGAFFILLIFCNKKDRLNCAVLFLNGTPKRIRIAVYTVKGCCPRPLDDGGLRILLSFISIHEKSDYVIKFCQLFLVT